MKRLLLPAALAVLLVVCLVAWLSTGEVSSNQIVTKIQGGGQTGLMDDRMLKTAHTLATTADTDEGQALAKEALRLSDHELDQAYATALREAIAAPPPAKGPLKQLVDQIARVKSQIAIEQTQIAKLTKEAATNADAADQLQVAKAQLELDGDELADAQQDLARLGGDKHARLEQEMQAHEAAQGQPVQFPKQASNAAPMTLYDRAVYWLTLRDRAKQLAAAQHQVDAQVTTLDQEHGQFEKLMTNHPGAPAAATGGDAESADVVARLYHLSNQRKTLAELDKRILDLRQLSAVYQRWQAAMETRRVAALHLMLASLAAILTVLLVVALIDVAIRHRFGKDADRRTRRQFRVIGTIAVQVVGALVILLIIFGMPTQTSTLIGLATAGITVVLKDFIVAFFGWFVLMGKNGIHVGDWVEIEGVGGEVIEIGMMRTVLLEVGNWTDRGHPTGRRVAFVNKFAIEGHYFNFSTADQWLWDELVVTLPAGSDPYKLAQQILETVQHETEADATRAEQDWQRATRQYGTRPFSAKPAVDLRPASSGLDVRVRYITRAPQRYEVKSRLFEAIVELLHKASAAQTETVQT